MVELYCGLDLSLRKTGLSFIRTTPMPAHEPFQPPMIWQLFEPKIGKLAPCWWTSASFGYPLTKDAVYGAKIRRKSAIAFGVVSRLRYIVQTGVSIDGIKIGIEDFAYRGKGSSHFDLAGLRDVVCSQMQNAGFPDPEFLAASSCRKRVVGDGAAKKTEVRAHLKLQGVSFPNLDEMDAFVVARAMLLMDLGRRPKQGLLPTR